MIPSLSLLSSKSSVSVKESPNRKKNKRNKSCSNRSVNLLFFALQGLEYFLIWSDYLFIVKVFFTGFMPASSYKDV